MKKLIEDKGYDPMEIGIHILKEQGYHVVEFLYSGGIYVYEDETEDKLLFHYSAPSEY